MPSMECSKCNGAMVPAGSIYWAVGAWQKPAIYYGRAFVKSAEWLNPYQWVSDGVRYSTLNQVFLNDVFRDLIDTELRMNLRQKYANWYNATRQVLCACDAKLDNCFSEMPAFNLGVFPTVPYTYKLVGVSVHVASGTPPLGIVKVEVVHPLHSRQQYLPVMNMNGTAIGQIVGSGYGISSRSNQICMQMDGTFDILANYSHPSFSTFNGTHFIAVPNATVTLHQGMLCGAVNTSQVLYPALLVPPSIPAPVPPLPSPVPPVASPRLSPRLSPRASPRLSPSLSARASPKVSSKPPKPVKPSTSVIPTTSGTIKPVASVDVKPASSKKQANHASSFSCPLIVTAIAILGLVL